MITGILFLLLLVPSFAQAQSQTMYVWIAWHGTTDWVEVQRQLTDGIYIAVAVVDGNLGKHRDVIYGDPGNTLYCYRLREMSSGYITPDLCGISPPVSENQFLPLPPVALGLTL